MINRQVKKSLVGDKDTEVDSGTDADTIVNKGGTVACKTPVPPISFLSVMHSTTYLVSMMENKA